MGGDSGSQTDREREREGEKGGERERERERGRGRERISNRLRQNAWDKMMLSIGINGVDI